MYRATNGEYNTFLATEYDVEKGPYVTFSVNLKLSGIMLNAKKLR